MYFHRKAQTPLVAVALVSAFFIIALDTHAQEIPELLKPWEGWATWDDEARTWHDKLAGTYVVRTDSLPRPNRH